MKSKYGNRETLGTQILKSHDEHMKGKPVEAMELAHECGKSYMKELIDVAENHSSLTQPYYIHVFCTREQIIKDRPVILFRFFARRTAPPLAPEQDLWYVDNDKEKLEVLWSLPQRDVFEVMLADKDVDKQLKKWIKLYLAP